MSLPPPFPPRHKMVNVGVSALAREVGLSVPTVSIKLKRGKTPDQIRVEAAARQTKLRRKEKIKEVAGAGTPPINAYVPPRTLPPKRSSVASPIVPTSAHASPAASTSAPKRSTRVPTSTSSTPPPVSPTTDLYSYADAVRDHANAEKMDEAKLRKAIADADRIELENAKAVGELVPVDYVRTWGTRFIKAAVEEMLKGPGELADELAVESSPVRCGEVVRGWVDRVLGKLRELEGLWEGQAGVGVGVKEEDGTVA